MYNDSSNDNPSDISVHTGFPNPAADSDRRSDGLSLDQLLIQHPSSTYMFRLSGHAWAREGIADGDIAVVDRAISSRPSDLVVAWRGDDFLLARRRQLPAATPPWGVVTAIVHYYRSEGEA